MHQNRASLFASDFYRRRGYRKEFRSEGHFYPFSSQEESRFASDFLRRGNRASWGLKTSRDFSGSGKNRRRNRRESRDFGALRSRPILAAIPSFGRSIRKKNCFFRSENRLAENIRANRVRIANRFVRIGPLRCRTLFLTLSLKKK